VAEFVERPLPRIAANGPDDVTRFYASLGWRDGMLVDQRKVSVHPTDYAGICLEFSMIRDPETRGLALATWLFCGPKQDPTVPFNKVRLYPGCFITERPA